jgi:hypothetical protein
MSKHMRTRRNGVDSGLRHSVEFADLLDPIYVTDVSTPSVEPGTVDPDMAFADRLVADMLVSTKVGSHAITVADEPEPQVEVAPEPEPMLVPVSRFADAGVDDDRLPLHAPTKRFRLR